MRKKLLALALALVPMLGFSQHRSESDAIAIAQDFWGGKVNRAKLKAVPQSGMVKAKARIAKAAASTTENKQSFYVINDEERYRFVIVSADERLHKILGFSDNGCFDAENAPEGLIEMTEGYNKTYEFLLSSESAPRVIAKESRKEVPALIKTQWNQGYPYNAECPIDPRFEKYADNEELYLQYGINLRGATGCVATAMAQVMNYHKYPACGHGSISYNTSSLNIPQSMDFSKMPFDWDNMAETYVDGNYSEAQKNAVAQLMHVCGNSVIMNYTQGGSGAQNPNLAYALINYFDYNPNLRHYEKNYFSSTEWKNIIHNDLEEGRPIIYTGQGLKTNEDGSTSQYGHAFILDGCDAEGKYHINWGYDGRYDGFFELTALDIDDSNYNLDQAMICNIAPQSIGESEDVFFADKFIHNDWLQNSKNVGGYASATLENVYCYAVGANTYNTKFNGEIGIGLFDANRNFIKSLDTNSANINAYSGWKSKYFSFKYDNATFTEGAKYNIAPYAKAKNSSKPTLLRTTMGVSDAYNVEVSDGKVIVRLGWLDIPTPTPEIVSGNYSVSAFNFSNTREDWTVQITQEENSDKVWFTNIDPIAAKDATVYGEIIGNGTQIRIPVGQKLGENKYLYNYTSTDDIIVYVSSEESTMTIQDSWGTVERGTSGDNLSQKELTQYSSSTFTYVEPGTDIVEAPVILVNNKTLTISCPTKDATIYYTIGGVNPDQSSTEYKGSVALTDNRVVKAVAYKGTKSSIITEKNDIVEFKVSTPLFIVSENKVTIRVADPKDAIIYFTTDGSDPKQKGQKYEEEITCEGSTTIKAYAAKNYWLDSEENEYVYTSMPTPDPDPIPNPDSDPAYEIALSNLTAGQLAANIPSSKTTTLKSLWISGELNGSDIKLIREMATSGSLTDLNIQNTRIVGGGEAYYSTSYTNYSTTADVVGEYMFSKCKNLITLILPQGTTMIESFALDGCENLKSISIPSRCEEVKMMAIYGCKRLETVNISESLKKLADTNFNQCPKLIGINVSADNAYFKSNEGILYTRNGLSLLRYPVGKSDVSFSIPTGITTIGSYAFTHSNLKNVDIPSSVTTIESCAFEYCNGMSKIEIPNSVTKIGTMSFDNCAELSTVKMSDNVAKIEMMTFAYCPSLQSFVIGKNVNEIDGTAFSGCASLKYFEVEGENPIFASHEGVIYTKDGKTLVKCPIAFFATSYAVPDGVEVIAENAFQKCQKIVNFTLPESLKAIEKNAFSGCAMTSISLPKELSSIDWMAFEDCDKLETFIIPDNVTDIPMMMLSGCDNLSYLYLPSNIKSVDLSAFARCKNLSTINSEIKDIASVEFKKSYDGKINAFDGIDNNCTWYVPDGCEEAYKAQSWWVDTWNIEIKVGIQDICNDADMKVVPGDHSVDIVSSSDKTLNIYNLQGRIVNTLNVKAGQHTNVTLPTGVYVINRNKIRIK